MKSLIPLAIVALVIVTLFLAGEAVERAEDAATEKAILIGTVPVDATAVKEKDGCISGFRVDTKQYFKWCGDYLIVEK